jgi:hypothetical protein
MFNGSEKPERRLVEALTTPVAAKVEELYGDATPQSTPL